MDYFTKTSRHLFKLGIICMLNSTVVIGLAIYRQKLPFISIIAIIFSLFAAAYDFRAAYKCHKYAQNNKEWLDAFKDH